MKQKSTISRLWKYEGELKNGLITCARSNSCLVRSKVLGDQHPDTIIVKHNLSECLLSMGKENESNKIKEEILTTIESNAKKTSEQQSVTTTAAETSASSNQAVEDAEIESDEALKARKAAEKAEKQKVVLSSHPPHMKAVSRKRKLL